MKKQRWEESEKRTREKVREEKESEERRRKKMQVRERVDVNHSVFPLICGRGECGAVWHRLAG